MLCFRRLTLVQGIFCAISIGDWEVAFIARRCGAVHIIPQAKAESSYESSMTIYKKQESIQKSRRRWIGGIASK